MNQDQIQKKNEFNRTLPVAVDVDVAVIGSGPAGIAACIAAKRHGAKVVLIERFPFFGGMSTLVPIATWPLNTAVEIGELDMPYDGIAGEIMEKMKKQNAIELHTVENDGVDAFIMDPTPDDKVATSKWYLFDPEVLKNLYFDMLHDEKVKLRINSLVVDSIVEDERIEALVVESLTRRELIKAKIFIDATGSADVVARSGSPTALGSRDNDGVPPGLMVPSSTTFRIAGVDTDNLDMYEVARNYERSRANGEIKVPLEGLGWQIVCKGVIQIFGTRVFNINPLDPQKAVKGEMKQRRQIRDIHAFLKKKIPAFKDSIIINTGVCLGMIGTRRIRGDYFITQEDILEAKKFEDAIATGTYRVEIWEPNGEKLHFQHLIGTWYTIPYRALLPKGLENVIVAGSCISGQIVAMGPWAIMPVCYKTGQAAGTAASICVKQDLTPRQIDVKELQNQLRQDGIFLGF